MAVDGVQLARGHCDELKRQLGRDEVLPGFVKEKIQWMCSYHDGEGG